MILNAFKYVYTTLFKYFYIISSIIKHIKFDLLYILLISKDGANKSEASKRKSKNS
jgi:hypothetical protein